MLRRDLLHDLFSRGKDGYAPPSIHDSKFTPPIPPEFRSGTPHPKTGITTGAKDQIIRVDIGHAKNNQPGPAGLGGSVKGILGQI